MAIQNISYSDKSYINQNASTPATNKVQDTDMNEIKSVVNNNASELNNLLSLNLQGLKGTVLWTNPSPASSFGAQNITLSSSDYDMLEIFYLLFNSANVMNSTRIIKGYSGRILTYASSGISMRQLTYSNDTTYAVGEDSDNNVRGIPLYVIGYKTGVFL
jgi:hypothetical protein